MHIFKHVLSVIFIFLASGCKELYRPEINAEQPVVVIQGMLTNNPGEVQVSVIKAGPYDSDPTRVPVVNCTVAVKDNDGNIYPLTHQGNGTYSNSSLYAREGKSYSLNVVTPEGDEFQSEAQFLPPKYKQDTIYAARVSKVELTPDQYGGFNKTSVSGIETYVDLSSYSNDLPKCRYTSRVTILYTYEIGIAPPQIIYCWNTFTPAVEINLTTSVFDKTRGIIKKHAVCFYKPGLSENDTRPKVSLSGYLVAFIKYNLSPETYRYYKKMKEQMEASGKIFDPIPSQVRGNIKCANQPEKRVYGFFEVSNVEKMYYRYIYDGTWLSAKDGFPEFTDNGESAVAPLFWKN